MDYRIIIFIMIFVSVAAGCILGRFIYRQAPTGELVIDTTDPETDRWLIKLDEPTEKAAKRHQVILKVSHRPIYEGDPKWPNEK